MADFSVIKNLYNITEPCGFSEELIQLGIEEIGALPEVLSDYYAELGTHKGLNLKLRR